jgi:hypothetical protein
MMTRTFVPAVGVVAAVLVTALLGCEGSDRAADDDDGTGGSDTDTEMDGGGDADTDADTDSDSDGDGGDTDVCDGQDFAIERTPVRLMILQDMSNSMNGPEGAPQSKWEQAQVALTTMLASFGGQNIEFGFDVFPDGSEPPAITDCGVKAPIIVDAEPGKEQDIIDLLPSQDAHGSTPLHCELKKFTEANYAPKFLAPGVDKYLLVVSDGADTCGTQCMYLPGATAAQLGAITAKLLSTKDIKTIVIGFGEDVAGAEDQLNAIAAAGGTPFDTFIPCADQAALEDALVQISGTVVSCIFDLEDPNAAADPDKVNFYFDDEVVGYDEGCAKGTGWQWANTEHTKVEFCDEACDRLKSGDVATVSAKFGCKTVPVE